MLLLLAAGCPEAKPECDTGAWCGYPGTDDTAADGDDTGREDTGTTWTYTDTTWWYDSGGRVGLFYVGGFDFRVTTAGAVAGMFGIGYYSARLGDWACWDTVALPYEGPGPDCPACDFTFDGGPADSTLGGDHFGPSCAALGVHAGMWDGVLDYDWGYAATYDWDYGGGPVTVEKALMFSYGGGWYPIAFNYADRIGVTGYAAAGTLAIQQQTGRYYYYYYY